MFRTYLKNRLRFQRVVQQKIETHIGSSNLSFPMQKKTARRAAQARFPCFVCATRKTNGQCSSFTSRHREQALAAQDTAVTGDPQLNCRSDAFSRSAASFKPSSWAVSCCLRYGCNGTAVFKWSSVELQIRRVFTFCLLTKSAYRSLNTKQILGVWVLFMFKTPNPFFKTLLPLEQH